MNCMSAIGAHNKCTETPKPPFVDNKAAGQLPPGIFAHLDLYYVICVTQFTQ